MYVERVLLDAVWDALEAYWRPPAIHDASAGRTLFALQLERTTGLRLGELARATVGDLRCTELTDKGSVWSPPLQASLHVPLTLAALRQVIERGYRIAAQVLAALEQATPHWLRHTFGTHALEHGAALEVVQQLMGHASIATTSKYLHPEKRRCAADMDKVFGA
ncbi:tyrosine-type recombinase/integrase [Pandoraea sp. NPDC090278]|uniref:tyrosine-type recombinase/integrase n=1 Tax=Pandoraea sp. NPDC090278 TaxID=3364391 RepID=UPI00383B0ADC